MKLPFCHDYPYTNFEQLNLDKLLNTVSGFDSRITECENKVTEIRADLNTEIENRIAGDNALRADLESETQARIASDNALHGDLESETQARIAGDESLDTRVTALENSVGNIDDQISGITDNIDGINDRIDDVVDDIGDINTDLTGLHDQVDAIPIVEPNAQGEGGTTLNSITIDGERYYVDEGTLVEANPVGTPTGTMNTIKINNDIYNIAGSGGGGSGSTVVVNQQGIPVAPVESLEVDSVLYSVQNLAVSPTVTQGSNDVVTSNAVYDAIQNMLLNFYPVGSIYISTANTNPGTLFGGTWETFGTGRTLVGVDTSDTSFNTVMKTGGNKNIQSHSHRFQADFLVRDGVSSVGTTVYTNIWGGTNCSVSSASGGLNYSTAGNSKECGGHRAYIDGNTGTAGSGNAGNLQPYITVYMWRRTA